MARAGQLPRFRVPLREGREPRGPLPAGGSARAGPILMAGWAATARLPAAGPQAAVPPRRLPAPSAGTARWPALRPPLSPPPPARPGCRRPGDPRPAWQQRVGQPGRSRFPLARSPMPARRATPARRAMLIRQPAPDHAVRITAHCTGSTGSPGKAVKNSLARRVSAASSRRPLRWPLRFAFMTSPVGVRVVVELADLDVIEHREGVVGQHGERAVQRDQVGRDRAA